jgi:hypothetical protein
MQQQGQPMPRVRASKKAYVQLGALLVVALVAFFVTWFLVRGGNGSGSAAVPAIGKPAIVTEVQLRALAAKTKFPVYWAGPRRGAYELTRTTDGRIYVRYLESASQIGTRVPKYLTVGTYPRKHAFLAIRRAAKRPGGVSLKIPNGGMLVFNTSRPTSVYFGYPKRNYQVEVFDPSSQQARTLVLAGRITPVA